jgi:hypothetical protein
MPKKERQSLPNGRTPDGSMPTGALTLLILRVLRSGTLHGYAIAQRIHSLSSEVLQVEFPRPIARFASTV